MDRAGASVMACIFRPAMESSRKAEEMRRQDLRVEAAQGLLGNM